MNTRHERTGDQWRDEWLCIPEYGQLDCSWKLSDDPIRISPVFGVLTQFKANHRPAIALGEYNFGPRGC